MTHTELKQAILDYIKYTYKAEFIGKLIIKDIEPIGYTVSFYLDNPDYPLLITADLPDKEFLQFIKEEIKNRNLVKTKFYKLIKLI